MMVDFNLEELKLITRLAYESTQEGTPALFKKVIEIVVPKERALREANNGSQQTNAPKA